MNQTRKDIAGPGAEPRILVVEDDSDLALVLAYNLEAEGYVVESVERGDEAQLRLVENPPDLVILDWMLPGVSGLEICRRLRARKNTRRLPVIMVTARGEEAQRVLENPGRVFTRAQLLDSLWNQAAETDERTVNVYVGRLRRRLSMGSERDPIRTVHGTGYAFDETFGKR
jgi:DNA-binding response OmpR family regulator